MLNDVLKNGTEVKDFKGKEKMEERTFAIDSMEYRTAFLKSLQGKDLEREERAAITAVAAIPTTTMNQIVSIVEEHPILQAIDMTQIPGYVTFPAETAMADASWSETSTDSTATLTPISLAAHQLIKTVEVTAQVELMSVDNFENWLVRRLGEKIQKALAAAVVMGTGASQPTGILTTIASTTGTFTKAGMNYKDLMQIIASLGTNYAGNASFVMPRELFYKDVLGMTTTSGDKVVVADAQSPGKFNILGYPVIIEDGVKVDHIIFGDLKKYKLNIGANPTVERDSSVGFRSGSTVYRAMTLADGKLADTSALVVYKRAAS